MYRPPIASDLGLIAGLDLYRIACAARARVRLYGLYLIIVTRNVVTVIHLKS